MVCAEVPKKALVEARGGDRSQRCYIHIYMLRLLVDLVGACLLLVLLGEAVAVVALMLLLRLVTRAR